MADYRYTQRICPFCRFQSSDPRLQSLKRHLNSCSRLREAASPLTCPAPGCPHTHPPTAALSDFVGHVAGHFSTIVRSASIAPAQTVVPPLRNPQESEEAEAPGPVNGSRQACEEKVDGDVIPHHDLSCADDPEEIAVASEDTAALDAAISFVEQLHELPGDQPDPPLQADVPVPPPAPLPVALLPRLPQPPASCPDFPVKKEDIPIDVLSKLEVLRWVRANKLTEEAYSTLVKLQAFKSGADACHLPKTLRTLNRWAIKSVPRVDC